MGVDSAGPVSFCVRAARFMDGIGISVYGLEFMGLGMEMGMTTREEARAVEDRDREIWFGGYVMISEDRDRDKDRVLCY
ncbi:hypothetical protein BPOR_0040g00180 [Botrytis porri]|uniref:Uncharacterized protein n=1 Tax=Botrytis porri TaxID=87229 RepID=A0A4Z1L2N7_9HELO|nr:hypothetical protein BPOR_0040g00180 [Botrytis porri]